MILDALAIIVILLVPFNIGVTVFLFNLLRHHPSLTTLRSRTYTQFVLLLCSLIGGLFGIVRLIGIHLDPTAVTLLLVGLILLPSLPGAYWTYTYLHDDFA